MSVTTDNPGAAAVRPFTIPKVPEAELKELRSRIAATAGPTGRPSRMTRKVSGPRP